MLDYLAAPVDTIWKGVDDTVELPFDEILPILLECLLTLFCYFRA